MAKQINLGRFRGEDAKINGVNTLTIRGAEGVHVSQTGSDLIISGDGFGDHVDNHNNPHQVTKQQIGLGNVDNKSESTIITDMKESLVPSDISDVLGYMPADVRKAMTEQQVNAAIASAISIKQDVLTGTVDQIVGFDSNGKAIATPKQTMEIDDQFIPNSTHPVQSRVIQDALNQTTVKVNSINQRVTSAEEQIGRLDDIVTDDDEVIATLETNLTAARNDIDSLNGMVVHHNTEIVDLREDTNTNTEDITTLKTTTTEHTQSIGIINNTLVRHTNSIDSLTENKQDKLVTHTIRLTCITDYVPPSGSESDFDPPDLAVITVLHGHSVAIIPPDIPLYVPEKPVYQIDGTTDVNFQIMYHKKKAKLTVIFTGPSEDLPYSIEQDVVVGTGYTVVPAPIPGLEPEIPRLEGIMPETGITAIISYKPGMGTLTINFSWGSSMPSSVRDNVVLPSSITMNIPVGDSYIFTPPPIYNILLGYMCFADPIYGIMSSNDISMNAIYTDYTTYKSS